MKHQLGIFLLGIFCLILNSQPAYGADAGIGFQLQRGTSESLFGDSTNTFDTHTTSQLEIKYYPISKIELKLSGSHTYYHETSGLSNMFGQFGITLIPLSETSPVILQVSGNLNGAVYHREFDNYDNNYAEGEILMGYQFSPTALFKTGLSVRSTAYINSETGDKRDVQFFAGGNLTLPGKNSLNLETGFATTNYTHKDNIFFEDSIAPGNLYPTRYKDWRLAWVGQSESDLWSFYISPRLSRPLGLKSGINITYIIRNFQNYDHSLLLGFTTEYLSPWSTVWEGENITAKLKSYLIPRTILEAGIGYWDRVFLKTIESTFVFYINAKNDPARQDWQVRYFINAQWPLLSHGGLYFEPNLRINYTKNRSNKPVYRYSDYSIAVGLSIRL